MTRAGAGIDAQRADLDLAGGEAGGAAQQRADTGEQFLGHEGLGEVIVGTGVEARDLVAPAVARGQDQDRHGLAVLAPFLEHAHAVELGQAEVEDHRVVRLGVAEEMAFLAVGRGVDHIAGIAQRLLQEALEILVVFNKQKSHCGLPW